MLRLQATLLHFTNTRTNGVLRKKEMLSLFCILSSQPCDFENFCSHPSDAFLKLQRDVSFKLYHLFCLFFLNGYATEPSTGAHSAILSHAEVYVSFLFK